MTYQDESKQMIILNGLVEILKISFKRRRSKVRIINVVYDIVSFINSITRYVDGLNNKKFRYEVETSAKKKNVSNTRLIDRSIDLLISGLG